MTEDGFRVIDVYESREAADQLAQEQIRRIVAELELPMPEISESEVYAYLSPETGG